MLIDVDPQLHASRRVRGRGVPVDLEWLAGRNRLAAALARMEPVDASAWAGAAEQSHADYLAYTKPVKCPGDVQMAEIIAYLDETLPDDTIYTKSVAAFVDEMERAEALGASYLVTHPGAHTGSGDEAGLTRVVEGLDEAHARCPGFNVRVLIETTAGQGTALGHRFEHIATILQRARCAARMDVCFDTCHAFAAGYPLGTDDGYAATFQRSTILAPAVAAVRQIAEPRLRLPCGSSGSSSYSTTRCATGTPAGCGGAADGWPMP